jgi:hypothetical protein
VGRRLFDLLPIIQPIAVAVSFERIGAQPLFLAVHQPVTITIFVGIANAVLVGVGNGWQQRDAAQQHLEAVAQLITVGV